MEWIPDVGSREGPVYLALAEIIGEDVASGRLRPGERLPTHRDLADRLRVTVGTVSRAYAVAARRGLLSGEVGRGTFVRGSAVETTPDPPLLDLSRNHPPSGPAGAEVGLLRETLHILAEAGDLHHAVTYAPEGGLVQHREAGASWVRRSGLDASPENTLVCGGSQHALATVFTTMLSAGDRVLTEGLTYAGMKAVADLLRLKLDGLPFDEDGLIPESFEAACREGAKAVYCAPTLHNPTASVMPPKRREAIAAIARRHSVWIVEDDVHALFLEPPLPPISSFEPDSSFFIASTSKVLAPGFRVAFLRVPLALASRLAAGIRATTWGLPSLTAEIVSRWIREGAAESLLLGRRREAASRQEIARTVLKGARLSAHPQGFHLWLHVPEPWRSDTFASETRRRGVLVTPASVFNVGKGPLPRGVRVCLGPPSTHEQLLKALSAVHRALESVPEDDSLVV